MIIPQKTNLTSYLLKLPRIVKILMVILLDIIFSILATWIGLSLRLEKIVTLNTEYALPVIVAIIVAIPIFFAFGMYRMIFRFSNAQSIQVLFIAIGFYSLIYALIFSVYSFTGIPRSIGLMQPMIMFLLVGVSRWIVKIWLNSNTLANRSNRTKKGIIIYGAGGTGRELASSLLHNNEFKLVAFVDENKNFWGGTIDGYPIYSPKKINKLIEKKNAQKLWLALPNIDENKRREIINYLKKLPIHVQTLPRFHDLINNKVKLADIRELDVNELLGRKVVKPDINLLQKSVFDKIVLVTGAGGSIGSELCRQILFQKPRIILLLENSEIALYNILNTLNKLNFQRSNKSNTVIIPILANILDETRMIHIFQTWKPHSVYHAAAFKHVPIIEENIIAGIKNNVLGTLVCAKAAIQNEVEQFVLVSTDKAVRPTNVMGASKRLAEMALQSLWNDPKNRNTRLCMVRFGNVLGSSGSVVPLFRKQIQSGGPLTLTDMRVTRYFMTIKEASQLVIQAGGLAKGGEIFLLDMGKPIKIYTLAKNMIETEGFLIKDKENTPWGDIEIQITGLRPGEKLYEELLIDEKAEQTNHPKILKAKEKTVKKDLFDLVLKKLIIALDQNDVVEIRDVLVKSVIGYSPSKDVRNLKR